MMKKEEKELNGSIKPKMDLVNAEALIWEKFGLKAMNLKAMDSYDDCNYFFKANIGTIENQHLSQINEDGYVLKVTNTRESAEPDYLDGQQEMMLHLKSHDLPVPFPIPNRQGELKCWTSLNTGGNKWYIVRVLIFVPGTTLYDVSPWKPEYFIEAGELLARVDLALQKFHHRSFDNRDMIWSLSSVPQLRKYTHVLKDPKKLHLVNEIIDQFEREVVIQEKNLMKGIIHGDFNEGNILMKKIGNEYHVHSIIDYGDSHASYLAYDLAINIMYMMTKSDLICPNEVGGYVISGYSRIRKVPDSEFQLLKTCVAARYAQSLILGAYNYSLDPSNDYVLITAARGWEILGSFWKEPQDKLYSMWQKTIDEQNAKI